MNTTLKPKMKAAEFSISLRSTRASWDFSSSTPVPEINDTYPGTSGRTQGDRKEISPAKNAAMGRGKLVIVFSQSSALTSGRTRNCAPRSVQPSTLWRFMGRPAVTSEKSEKSGDARAAASKWFTPSAQAAPSRFRL
jgi:hypothetical protein